MSGVALVDRLEEDLIFQGQAKSKVLKIRVREGDQVSRGQILLVTETEKLEANGEAGRDGRIKAAEAALVLRILIKEGDVLEVGMPILRLKPGCSHPVVMKDMCADCGADLRKNGVPGNRRESASAAVSMIHSIPELMVSDEQARRIGADDVAHLTSTRRLALLVDLDQTLIHTTLESVSNEIKDIHHFRLYGSNSPWYHAKLRPGTTSFLSGISKYYELHICTFGTRMYAHHIAKLLDPSGALFSNRILSRDEFLDPSLKTANMKSLFPCGDDMVCIIDDREDVWNYSPNLIHVRPYFYFKNTGDINAPFPKNAPTPSRNPSPSTDGSYSTSVPPPSEAVKHQYENRFADQSTDEDSDDYLLYLKSILISIHRNYYQTHDDTTFKKSSSKAEAVQLVVPSTKEIVPAVRKKALEGCRIVFSGLFPNEGASEERNRAHALVESFGATVQPDVIGMDEDADDFTTHVIAAKQGTIKVVKGRKSRHTHIVSGGWLKECIRRWERVDESLYPLEEDPSGRTADDLFRLPGGKPSLRRVNASIHCEVSPVASISKAKKIHPDHAMNSDSINESMMKKNGWASLSGLSVDEINVMDCEVDDEIGPDDGDESDPERSFRDELMDRSSEDRGSGEDDLETLDPDALESRETRKRKRDGLDDSDDEDDELDAKHLKSEDLGISSSSSDVDSHEFSDDEDTLGEMARDLDRALQEE